MAAASGSPSSPPAVVVALDFDGVICNSSIESSLSAWKGACDAWPTVFESATAADKDRTVQYLRDVRPVIETGFENLLLIRLLFEQVGRRKWKKVERRKQVDKSGRKMWTRAVPPLFSGK